MANDDTDWKWEVTCGNIGRVYTDIGPHLGPAADRAKKAYDSYVEKSKDPSSRCYEQNVYFWINGLIAREYMAPSHPEAEE